MLVLENDEFWSLYGTQSPSLFAVAGFLQGNGTSNNGTYASSNARDFGFNPALAGTANATYNATAKTIVGSVVAPAGTVTFNGGPIAGSLYNYNTPALLSSVAGNWALTASTGEGISLNISSTGSFTATSVGGCSFAGNMVPRPSGKNVFNVSLTFGPFPCLLAGQPTSGIALVYPLSTGSTQMIFAATNTARSSGTAAFGIRPPQVTMTVSNGAGQTGNFVITLSPTLAPATVANFLTYVNSGFYNGTVFHRHSPGFVLQGGSFAGPMSPSAPLPPLKVTNPPVALEVGRGLSNVRWTVAMARTDVPNSATSQFFINLADNVFLDTINGGYAVFGNVTAGTDFITTALTGTCVSYPALEQLFDCLLVPNLTITSATQTR